MNKRILVADDEKAVVKVLKDRFIHWGYEVDTAFDGEETLQKVSSFKPPLLLLDLKMPKMRAACASQKKASVISATSPSSYSPHCHQKR